MKPQMTDLNPPEKSRTYKFPGGEIVTLSQVTQISVSDSGNHRLRTADGKLHIVPTGWVHIEIDAEDWTL